MVHTNQVLSLVNAGAPPGGQLGIRVFSGRVVTGVFYWLYVHIFLYWRLNIFIQLPLKFAIGSGCKGAVWEGSVPESTAPNQTLKIPPETGLRLNGTPPIWGETKWTLKLVIRWQSVHWLVGPVTHFIGGWLPCSWQFLSHGKCRCKLGYEGTGSCKLTCGISPFLFFAWGTDISLFTKSKMELLGLERYGISESFSAASVFPLFCLII